MPKTYSCPVCAKAFNKPAHLLRHSLVHTQHRNFECAICQTRFGRHDSYKRHQIRVHGQSGSDGPMEGAEEPFEVKREASREGIMAGLGAVAKHSPRSVNGTRNEWNHDHSQEPSDENLRLASLLTSFSAAPQNTHNGDTGLQGQRDDGGQHAGQPPLLHEGSASYAGGNAEAEPSLEEILESILATSFDSLSSNHPSTNLFDGSAFASLQPSNAASWSSPATSMLSIEQASRRSSHDPTLHPAGGREGASATARAAQNLVAQAKDYVVHGVRLPQMPAATSTEELFWLAASRLSTLVPVVKFTRDEQSAMSKEDPVMFILALSFGTLWHKASSVREYGVALWKFGFSSIWTGSGFVLDNPHKMMKSRTIALYAHLFAFMCADQSSYRKAAHGFMTCRSVSKEAVWRRQRRWKDDSSHFSSSLRHLWASIQHHRGSADERARLIQTAEVRWQAWRETEIQNRTSIGMGVLDSQVLSFVASSPDDLGRGGHGSLRETLVSILLQSVEPSSDEAWAARSGVDWLAVTAHDGNSVGSTKQIGSLLASLLCQPDAFARSIRATQSRHLTMSALLEGLHFAWMGRKEEDDDWISHTTGLFHPSPACDRPVETLAKPSLEDEHRSVTEPAYILDGLTTWLNNFEPMDDSLQLHLRWHAICLEVCVEPWQICTYLLQVADVRAGKRDRIKLGKHEQPSQASARFRRAVYHCGAIIALFFHIPSSAVSIHCAQALCFALAVLASVVVRLPEGRDAAGEDGAGAGCSDKERQACVIGSLPDIAADRQLGHAGWPTGSSLAHAATPISRWILSGSTVQPVVFHHPGLAPNPTLSLALLKHILFEVRAIAPLSWHKSQVWISLVTSVVC